MKNIYSIKSKIEFNKILNKGKKHSTKYFLISYINSDKFQIGISVPKKLGGAVFRNKNKRIVKNLIHQINIYNLNKKLIIIINRPWIELTFEEKKKTLIQEIKKIDERY